MRAGFAYAEGAGLHGRPPERHFVRESRSAWFWGLGLPLILLTAALFWSPWWVAGFAIYPLQMLRLAMRFAGDARRRAWRAVFMVIGKFAEVAGHFKFLALRWTRQPARLIEYK